MHGKPCPQYYLNIKFIYIYLNMAARTINHYQPHWKLTHNFSCASLGWGPHRPACVIIMVAGVLAPNRQQTVNNHQPDSSVIKYDNGTYIILRKTNIALQPLNRQCSRDLGMSAICRFHCYWRVRLSTMIALHGFNTSNHPWREHHSATLTHTDNSWEWIGIELLHRGMHYNSLT